MSVLKKFKGHQTKSLNNNNNNNNNNKTWTYIRVGKKKKRQRQPKRDRLFTVGPMDNFSSSTAAAERQ